MLNTHGPWISSPFLMQHIEVNIWRLCKSRIENTCKIAKKKNVISEISCILSQNLLTKVCSNSDKRHSVSGILSVLGLPVVSCPIWQVVQKQFGNFKVFSWHCCQASHRFLVGIIMQTHFSKFYKLLQPLCNWMIPCTAGLKKAKILLTHEVSSEQPKDIFLSYSGV